VDISEARRPLQYCGHFPLPTYFPPPKSAQTGWLGGVKYSRP